MAVALLEVVSVHDREQDSDRDGLLVLDNDVDDDAVTEGVELSVVLCEILVENDTVADADGDCVVVELSVWEKDIEWLELTLFVDDSVDERIVDSEGVSDNDAVTETVAEVDADVEVL